MSRDLLKNYVYSDACLSLIEDLYIELVFKYENVKFRLKNRDLISIRTSNGEYLNLQFVENKGMPGDICLAEFDGSENLLSISKNKLKSDGNLISPYLLIGDIVNYNNNKFAFFITHLPKSLYDDIDEDEDEKETDESYCFY